MNDIKFKGYSYETDHVFEFDMWIPWEAEDEKGNTWYTKKMVIVRYTGLQDKYGIEIFEGDVMRDSLGFLSTVVWLDAAFRLKRDEHLIPTQGHIKYWSEMIVIGNVYEYQDIDK